MAQARMVFAAIVISALLSATSTAFASAINGTKIIAVQVLGTSSAAITFASAIPGSPACSVATQTLYIDVTTNKGKAAFSIATAALLANVAVDATGAGTCTTPSGGFPAENLSTLNVHNQ